MRIRTDDPIFYGKMEANIFFEWLYDIENYFSRQITFIQRALFVKFTLNGPTKNY